MASEVKRAHPGILKILTSFKSLLTGAVDLRLLSAPLVSFAGLQPEGLHQTANRGRSRLAFRLDQTAAGRRPAPQKIMRSPRRLFKTAGSRSGERGEFLVGSTRGQPRGKVITFHSSLDNSRAGRGPIKPARSGPVAQGCIAGSKVPNVALLAAPLLALVPGCLSSAVWLPGTVGNARSWCGHGMVSL
jgi:hypothetical protein